MKIAVISDIHDNIHNLVCALEDMKKKEVEGILCLGDLVMGAVAKVLANFDLPTFAVWGNNVGDRSQTMKISLDEGSNLELSETTYKEIEIDGKKIFLTHYPEIAEYIAKSGEFDVVFFGHTHQKSESKIGDCLLINPGEIAGNIFKESTYAIYNTTDNGVEFVKLEDAIITRTDKVEEFLKNNKR